MEDTLLIVLSTIGFIVVLLNNLLLTIIGIAIGLITIVLSFILKKISIISKVSVVILASITVILGILWFLKP
ncbi:MAG: hypothetical protein N2712_02215 [Brevinematales bacterium]|nr:hypothetical protein [Brevinematales bacterium]